MVACSWVSWMKGWGWGELFELQLLTRVQLPPASAGSWCTGGRSAGYEDLTAAGPGLRSEQERRNGIRGYWDVAVLPPRERLVVRGAGSCVSASAAVSSSLTTIPAGAAPETGSNALRC